MRTLSAPSCHAPHHAWCAAAGPRETDEDIFFEAESLRTNSVLSVRAVSVTSDAGEHLLPVVSIWLFDQPAMYADAQLHSMAAFSAFLKESACLISGTPCGAR